MKKLVFLILFIIGLNQINFTQMTTIYEGGINTSDSLYVDFISNGSSINMSTPNPDTLTHGIYLLNDGNYGASAIFTNWNKAIYHLYKNVPEIANYGYINYYINYTISDPNSQLSILTSDSLELKNASSPGFCGNLVESSPQNMIVIADTNFFQDSIIKIQVDLFGPIDSIYININYFRIDVDLSSYMMFATGLNELNNKEDYTILSNEQGVKISTSSFQNYQVSIFNLAGQEVFSGSRNESSIIPFKHKQGIYTVRIIDNDGKMYREKLFLK